MFYAFLICSRSSGDTLSNYRCDISYLRLKNLQLLMRFDRSCGGFDELTSERNTKTFNGREGVPVLVVKKAPGMHQRNAIVLLVEVADGANCKRKMLNPRRRRALRSGVNHPFVVKWLLPRNRRRTPKEALQHRAPNNDMTTMMLLLYQQRQRNRSPMRSWNNAANVGCRRSSTKREPPRLQGPKLGVNHGQIL